MWVVYALRSCKDGWLYIGISSKLKERLKEHNRGDNRSTKSRAPFELFYFEECDSRLKARRREKYLKSGTGREFLKYRLKEFVEAGGGNSVARVSAFQADGRGFESRPPLQKFAAGRN